MERACVVCAEELTGDADGDAMAYSLRYLKNEYYESGSEFEHCLMS